MNNRLTVPSGYIKGYKIVPPLNLKGLSKYWNTSEIDILLMQIKNKRTHEDIAKKLNRPVSDIRSKLKAIAADMYMKGNVPYDEIHKATGVEKNTLVISSSIIKDHVDVSIYDFPETIPETMVNVDIKDNIDEVIVTVSVESPFSAKSICEHLSTPIITTCTRFAKTLAII